MQVRIGIRNVSREVVIESEQSVQAVKDAVTGALDKGSPLTLEDDKGHTVIVPAEALGYLDIAPETGRRVGFGA
ncbi:DUF3107 domain-containing protein [Calidifontibacter sp. DB0510]|uniref:DUF3107 domain-containing protein n=1 Tax=Metallococcus carri TaxID=1656884 RepID=A0A967EAP8_9MICO|nr:DUF3107 domain-containing protein [Metallococcus carri]NHN56490.1 DUF3107 domain-containing protein [Metallococcus carri]NOP36114.1 DUF3107 family protein [Calidifontibacter sp. DB2511S]